MIYIQLETAILYVWNSQPYLVAIWAATQLASYSAPTSAIVAGTKIALYSSGETRSRRVSSSKNGHMTSQLVSWVHRPKSVDRVDGHAESVVGRDCSSATADRWVPIQRQIAEKKNAFHRLFNSCTPPATYSAVPRPNITIHQFFSSALTGPVMIGVNKSNTIWCSARNRVYRNCGNFSGFTITKNLCLPSTEDSRVTSMCTWSVLLAAVTRTMLRGSEFFISREHSLLLLGLCMCRLLQWVYTL